MSAAHSRSLTFALSLALTLFVCAVPQQRAAAQVLYGSIVGNVTDPAGAMVANAEVSAKHSGTGRVRATRTNQTGAFTLTDVSPGDYAVEFSAPGFQKQVHTGVRVEINTVTRADAELRTGVVVETITVQSNATLLQTDKADVRTELTTKALTELPLPSYRNYQSLIDLVPGATPGVLLNSINDTPMRDLATNVNGTNYNNNDTRIDGALNRMNVISSHVLYVPPAESIDTVNVVTANFEAEQGMAGGVSVTVATKSGTNAYHGSAFAFHTNNTLYAKNFFFTDPKAPKNIVNIDGFTLGGPIKRNRLFFFGDWEGMRERKNALRLTTVATPDQRAGDFSAYNTPIHDPATGSRDGSGRLPFPNARVPASLFSPITLKMQSFVPAANRPGPTANFFNSDSQVIDRDNFDLKLDWNRTDRHTIWGKYGRMDAHVQCNPSLGEAGGAGLCLGQKSGTADTMVQLATIGHTLTLTPSVVVDGTVGYFRSVQNIRGPLYGTNFGLDVLGIPGTNGTDIRYSGQPIFDITGYASLGDAGLGNTNPAFRKDAGFSHTSNVSWIKGSHTFRFGFEMVRYQQNDWQANTTGGVKGQFSFTGGLTALRGGRAPNQYNAYADFLIGLPQSVSKDLQFYIPQTAREWRFGWYAQDRWQATRNLTLTMGLRYEYYPLFTRADQGIERYDPETNKVFIGRRGGQPDNAGIEMGKRLFAPRFGLAYRLGKSTVVRGGFGITIDPSSLWSSMQRLYPASFGSRFVGLSSFEAFRPIEQGIPIFGGPDISSGVIDLPPDAATTTVRAGHFPRGYIESWNLILERRLPGDLVTSLGYVGTHSVRPLVNIDINAGSPGLGTAGRPYFSRYQRSIATNVLTPNFGANYNSLQATLNRRFSNGMFAKVSYTFSRATNFTDNSPGGLTFNTPNQLSRNRARSGYDRTHNLQLSGIYELPFGPRKKWLKNHNVLSLLARDWQLNATLSSYTGTPFTVTSSSASLNAPGNTQTADQVKEVVEVLGNIGPGQRWFDPTAFRAVTEVRFGNTGRNILRNPGIINVNGSVFRNIRLTERFSLQFRAETYNLSNTPHFDGPATDASNAVSFASITSAREDQRYFQFALRLIF